jgi:hypothetical protein
VQRKNEQTLAKLQMGRRFSWHVHGNTELKVVLKMSAQAGQSGALNKTSLDAMTQDDDFREVKRLKRHISDTIQKAKESTKPVPTSAVVKLPLKVVLIHNFFAPLSTHMHTETTGAENALPEQEALYRSGRSPP